MLTDEHEHAMKVWEEACAAWDDTPADPNAMHSGDQAAAAVIAADRAGLVARVVEWLRNGGGTDISQLNGSMQMLFLKGMNRYADAIERGEPFRD